MRQLRGGSPVWIWGAILVVFLAVFQAGNGRAVDYRYWTYWTFDSSGTWQFAPAGPASMVPADGAVEGWRFAVSSGTNEPATQPRVAGASAFDRFCGDTPPAATGKKRVAVVIDYGTAEHEPPNQNAPGPRGGCVVVPSQASAAVVLGEIAAPRIDKGLICGIDGYPRSECAVVVSPSTAPKSSTTDRAPAKAKPTTERSQGAAVPQESPTAAAPTDSADGKPKDRSIAKATQSSKPKSGTPTETPSASATGDNPSASAAASVEGPGPTPTFLTAAPDADPGSSALPVVIGGLTIIAGGSFAWWRARRRQSG